MPDDDRDLLPPRETRPSETLGNQLFQITGALAVAESRRDCLSLPAWDYAKFFSVPERVFAGARGCEADELVPHLGAAAPYFQDYALVVAVEPAVRSWFAPSALSLGLIERQRIPPGHRTGVHVRRSDYLLSPRHYLIPDVAWYSRAMEIARARRPDTLIEVVSDDPAWCRRHFPTEWVVSASAPAGHQDRRDEDGHPLPHPNEVADFWRLATADAVVTANSAYSWWAAFLSSDPSPITPAEWYGPANAHLDVSRLIPPHWTAL